MMKRLTEMFAEKYPNAWAVAFRTAAGVLRQIPYEPVIEGEGEVDGPDWLVVRPSRIPGANLGLFSTQFVPSGTYLCEYKGTRLTGLQLLRTRDWTYIANYRFDFFIDAREHRHVKGRYLNHNFDPSTWNVGWEYRDGRILQVAIRDIQPDEELYTDYGAEYWENFRHWNGWAGEGGRSDRAGG